MKAMKQWEEWLKHNGALYKVKEDWDIYVFSKENFDVFRNEFGMDKTIDDLLNSDELRMPKRFYYTSILTLGHEFVYDNCSELFSDDLDFDEKHDEYVRWMLLNYLER